MYGRERERKCGDKESSLVQNPKKQEEITFRAHRPYSCKILPPCSWMHNTHQMSLFAYC